MFVPAWLFAILLIVTVYFVLAWRLAPGVHVTVFEVPSQANVPVIAGEEDIAPSVTPLSIAKENVMTIFVFIGMLFELLAGLVLVTVGGTGPLAVVNENTY